MSGLRAERRWLTTSMAVVLGLVVLSPLFAWAASEVGYAEPLEHAAAATGAADAATVLLPGLLPGYGVPGLGPHLGTFLAGLLGVALALVIGAAIGRGLAE